MKIATKYQIFDLPVEITDNDAKRLTPHLSGWNQLNEMFLLGVSEQDLRRLVVLEVMKGQRITIINRLLSRIAKIERARQSSRILKTINQNLV